MMPSPTAGVAILGLSDRILEWVTPVLYLRGHDARLFTLSAPAEDTSREGVGSIRGGQPGGTIIPKRGSRRVQPLPAPVPVPPSHLVRTLTGHTGPVNEMAFSPNGRLLATASADGTARLWDPATGKHRHTLTGHTGPVYGVAFSPNGRLLATASADGTARLWDPATGKHRHTLTGHTGPVYGVAFSPNGRLLATASGDETARLWD